MKHLKYAVFLFIALFVSACSDDDNTPEQPNENRTEIQAWIEDTMRKQYYWNNKIPQNPEYPTHSDEEDIKTFFKSLLYEPEDGKTKDGNHYYYSTINKASANTRHIYEENTYGFEFAIVNFTDKKYYAALVLYVLPNTPAAKSGLKRGDWITQIDEKYITTSEEIEVLYGSTKKMSFTIAQWNNVQNNFINSTQLSIDPAVAITANPIFLSKTLSRGGKKIGYLVYNSFTAGVNKTDQTYDNQLRTLSATSFSDVDEFVLDLRYNGGGLLTSTQLLCAILGHSSVLSDNKFGYLEDNTGKENYFTASSKILGTGKNLNLNRLFVLVSSATASASEAVINLLNPYMEVVVIGRITEGKNLASNTLISTDKVWEMHPITSKIFNRNRKSDYASGWIPDINKGDVFDYDDEEGYITPQDYIYDLGDPNERLLSIALEIIDGANSRSIADSKATGSAEQYKEDVNSLKRKTVNSVIVD